MDCAYFQNLIEKQAEEALSPEEQAALEAHVRRCPECRALQEAYAFLSRELSEDLEEAPETLLPGVMEGVWAENHRRVRKRNRRRWTGFLSAAACVALAVGLGYPLFAPKGSESAASLFDAAPMEAMAEPEMATGVAGNAAPEARIAQAPAAVAETAAGESEAPAPEAEETATESVEQEAAALPMVAAAEPMLDAVAEDEQASEITEVPAAEQPAPVESGTAALPAEPAEAAAPAATEAPAVSALSALAIVYLGSESPSLQGIPGDSFQLEAQLSPGDAAPSLHWRSTDEAVATVDTAGCVSLCGAGSCTILLSAEGLEARCEITVSLP